MTTNNTCSACSQPTGGAIFCSARCHTAQATQHRVCVQCENALAMDDPCEVCRDCAAAAVEKSHVEHGGNFCKECSEPIAVGHKFCSAFCAEDFLAFKRN